MKTIKTHMYMVYKAGVVGMFCKHFVGACVGFKAYMYRFIDTMRVLLNPNITRGLPNKFQLSYIDIDKMVKM